MDITQFDTDYATRVMADFPKRTTGIRMVIRALKAAGRPVVGVDLMEGDTVTVTTERDALIAAHQVDMAYLLTDTGQFVSLVMCNGDTVEDTVANWSESLSDIIWPVVDRLSD